MGEISHITEKKILQKKPSCSESQCVGCTVKLLQTSKRQPDWQDLLL